MPNYVYCTIKLNSPLTEKQSKILGDIKKATGIARYYVPMPEDLANSKAIHPLTEENIELERKYGYTSWYPWALEHWGTKWGCCGFTIDGKILTFSTAWSALKDSIINQFAQDFPNFEYSWEEEQGFGAYREYIDAEQTFSDDWDLPLWGEHPEIGDTDHNIGYLTEDYSKMGEKYPRGFYADFNLEEYLGDNPNTVFPHSERLEKQYHEAVRKTKWYLAPDMGITVLEEDKVTPDVIGLVKSNSRDDHRCKFVLDTNEGLVHFDGRCFYTDYDRGIKSVIPAPNWYDLGFMNGYNNFCIIEKKLKPLTPLTFPNKNAEESYNRGVADGMQEKYITG